MKNMKHLLALVALLLCTGNIRAYQVTYQPQDSVKVERLLCDARKAKRISNPVIYFARQLLGLPYVAHTLEVNDKEQLVVNLRQLDCTTYVENVVALTMCLQQGQYRFKDFCDNLLTIRYRKDCKPQYVSRLHYFTEWITDNTCKGLCREIQQPVPPFTAWQQIKVGFMSAHPEKYRMLKAHPEDIPAIANTEKALNKLKFRYIPKSKIGNTKLLRQTIHNGDILALTTKLDGLDIQHIGFAVWHKDGLHLLNASSLRHKVVEEPKTLSAYLQKQKSMTGVRVVRLAPSILP